YFCFSTYSLNRYLPSFPTRRSSDLDQRIQILHLAGAVPDEGVLRLAVAEEGGTDDLTAAVDGVRRAETAAKGAQVRALHLVRLRSEEHTSELQSRSDLVCRLLLEKK